MSLQRKTLVAGNWKMNGNAKLLAQFVEYFSASRKRCETVLCVPSLLTLNAVSASEKCHWLVGGQDVSAEENGAHTGDLSAQMLVEAGCQFVIIGHSERRADHGESNQLIARKAEQALAAGLTPIVCVGESLETRNEGSEEAFVEAQLSAVFERLSAQQLSDIVIAYEPIWAIGTGVTASPEQAQAMHRFIRQRVAQQSQSVAKSIRLLYGGSVKPANAEMLFSQEDIDGGLIGGASLDPKEFEAICLAASE
ncbi:triose-phosphate isomerase [Alteromonas oceanisediminis]|uniref:triose-phosphate isomerase n=1 Tax=Alteromonas oceanisediminis TaxID=2836180 RepID=UPI001BDA55F2|nr:triose-phosphate isomerase [Alteromonas oceanisediminis]MBT0586517.1 triose-phosphate isomerase [Alteromonas oceanisediminis]